MVKSPTLISTTEAWLATSYNNQRKLVRLSNGTLYAVYWKDLADKYQIYVKKSVNGGATWTDETRISVGDGMENYDQNEVSIAVDSNDYLHVVWAGGSTTYGVDDQIWYRKFTTVWGTVTRLSTYAGMDETHQNDPSIAIASNDYLHVTWAGCATGYETWRQIWYRKYIASWGTVTRLTTLTTISQPSNPCVTVDSNGYPHVVWGGRFTGDNWGQIYYTKYISSWSTPIIISTYSGMDDYSHQNEPCIAVDSSDYLHVVWNGRATGFPDDDQIWYAKYTTSWITPVRISTYDGMIDYSQDNPSIGIGADDYLYVIWWGKATGYTDYEKAWSAKYTTSWATPICHQTTGRSRHPNVRWSRYPSTNQIIDHVDYMFLTQLADPFNIMFDYFFVIEPTTVTTQYVVIFGE